MKKYSSKIQRHDIDVGEWEVGGEWEGSPPLCKYCENEPAQLHFIPEGYFAEDFVCTRPDCLLHFARTLLTDIEEVDEE